MAKTKISEFSPTPANNTDIDNINIAEGCAPSGINDAIRELMSQLKDFQAGTAGDSFNGPIGTSTPAAGAFTTLTASSTATLNTLASSGATLTGGTVNGMAIGGTTAAAGAFTTLAASGAVTLSGGTANGVTYLNGSKVLTSGSALTFDGSALGVGTASPANKLDVQSTSNTSARIWTTGGEIGNYAELKLTAYNNFSGKSQSYIRAISTANGNSGTALAFAVEDNGFGNPAEGMRLTSTGLGIGTSSPSSKLDIQGGSIFVGTTTAGNSTVGMTFGKVAAGGGTISNRITLATYGGAYGAYMEAYADLSASTATYLAFGTTPGGGGSPLERLRLDSAGNLGLGVTPSAWRNDQKVMQLGLTGNISARSDAEVMGMGSNTYLSSSTNLYTYIVSGSATNYQQYDGAHYWLKAPSGTAGNAISFTQAMTLDANGRLIIGNTAVIGPGKINTYFNGSTEDGIDFKNTNTGNTGSFVAFINSAGGVAGSISQSSATSVLYNVSSDYRLKTVIGPVADAGQRIDALQPVEYTWNVSGEHTRGFLAHEFQEVYADSVTGIKDAVDAEGNPVYQAMQASSSEVIADLVAEIQSLRQRLAALEAA